MHTDGSAEKEKRLRDNTAGNLIPRPVSHATQPICSCSKQLGSLKERRMYAQGTAEECAQAIMFCVTNDFTTGNTIEVDGGVLSASL